MVNVSDVRACVWYARIRSRIVVSVRGRALKILSRSRALARMSGWWNTNR
ncbi:Uncharacterized protein APZ42_025402 [Daphnia magna]|uniref:Uncharacterized protein n=1 Tax=Daphnia magna TaxID=35525 RepID=A0A164T4A9_9CRUS|nr:Uncharacterized protein APZ42_025402 [Daphnia magna]